MVVKLNNKSHIHDNKVFGERLTKLRKQRWEEYKLNQDKKDNPYEKYACCRTQDSLAAELGVERRTLGRWELGTSVPPLDKASELCNLLGCNMDYLLGAVDLKGSSPILLASRYSGISTDIITYATENSDYKDCLNYFMHPNNCSKLFNHITLNAWKDYLSEHEFDFITDPLKSFVENIFYQYQAFTPFSEYSLDSYKQFVIDAIPTNSITFSSRKSDKRLNVNPCIPDAVAEKLSLSSKNKKSYDAFIDYIVACSYETLNTKALLEVKKNELAKSFIKLFEGYLTSD